MLRKGVDFSLNRLTVVDVTFDFAPWHYSGEYTLEGLGLVLRKDGNLPVEITDISIAVGDVQSHSHWIQFGQTIMIDRQQTVKVRGLWLANKKMQEEDQRRHGGLPLLGAVFRTGDKYLVKGKVFFGRERGQSVDFEKELVVVNAK